jgi:hypothetical protein
MAYRNSQATTTLTNWNFNQYHVSSELVGGEFVSAESTLIAAGPPELGMTGITVQESGDVEIGRADVSEPGDTVYPIGVVENFGITQALQVQKLFEIGSARAYMIPGKVLGSVSIARAMYSGPSLLKVLYAYYKQNAVTPYFNHKAYNEVISGTNIPHPDRPLLSGEWSSELLAVKTRPGYGHMWLNVASDLFKQPTGIMVYFRNSLDMDFGAIYLESVYLTGHQLSLNSGMNVLMESASMEFENMRPVDVTLKPYTVAALANNAVS